MLSLVLLAIVAYAATNIDNLFVLLAFLAQARGGRHRVIAGQCAGSLVLIAGSILFAALLMHLPAGYPGLLGLLPIGVGLSQAWEHLGPGFAQWTKAGQDDARAGAGATASSASAAAAALSNAASTSSTRASSFLTVAGVAIANGSDNLAVYVPLYASHTPSENALISLVFVVMTGLWCAAALWLVEHPLLGAPIRRYGTALLPLILLAIGVSVIARDDTLRLVFGI
jgi:cadmium resistance protein CadD (predicted permease)